MDQLLRILEEETSIVYDNPESYHRGMKPIIHASLGLSVAISENEFHLAAEWLNGIVSLTESSIIRLFGFISLTTRTCVECGMVFVILRVKNLIFSRKSK